MCHYNPLLIIDCSSGPPQGLKIWGGHIVLGGDNVPPLVEIGLTDLPKSGRGHVPPRPPPPACDGPAYTKWMMPRLNTYIVNIYILSYLI